MHDVSLFTVIPYVLSVLLFFTGMGWAEEKYDEKLRTKFPDFYRAIKAREVEEQLALNEMELAHQKPSDPPSSAKLTSER